MQVIEQLLNIIATLRSPQGCPWDREQTHQSIRRELVEESYELLEAIDSLDDAAMKEELGDLLLQVVFHAQLGAERKAFDFEAIVQNLSEKLVRRHPHVFGDKKASHVEEAWAHWDDAKKKEKDLPYSTLEGVPKSLPALMYAQKIQKKAAKVGFDWKGAQEAFEKVREELQELEEAIQKQEGIEEELGDLLFTIVNVSCHLKLDAEQALRLSVEKLIGRFKWMEERLRQQGKEMESLTRDQQDLLWQQAKQATKKDVQASIS